MRGLFEGPLQHAAQIARCAHGPAHASCERLELHGRVDVDQGNEIVSMLLQGSKGLFQLCRAGHVDCARRRRGSGQKDFLILSCQHGSCLAHEGNTAENDVAGVQSRNLLYELQAVPNVIAELDHTVLLIVMTNNGDLLAQFFLEARAACLYFQNVSHVCSPFFSWLS